MLYSTEADVFVGTNWGLVFRCEPLGLIPQASYQLFTQDVRALWFFVGRGESVREVEEGTDEGTEGEGALVLFGKGFSHLMTPNSTGKKKRAFALLASIRSSRNDTFQ